MNIGAVFMKAFMTAVACSIGLVIAWVGFWSAIVPQVFDGWTWHGYELLIKPLFVLGGFLGGFGGLAVGFLGSNRSSRKR